MPQSLGSHQSIVRVLNKFNSHGMKGFQLLSHHVCTGKFGHIALREELIQHLFLSKIQARGMLELIEKFFGCPLRCFQFELLFQVTPDGIGNQDTEKPRVVKMV